MPETNMFAGNINGLKVEDIDKAYDRLLNNESLDEVVDTLKDIANNNEDITHLREIQSSGYEETEDLRSEVNSYPITNNGTPNYTIPANDELKEADLDITEIDKLNKLNESKINKDSVKSNPMGVDLTDEEADNIANILLLYRNNDRLNVYGEMIPSLRQKINNLCLQSNIPLSEKGMVAKYIIDQFWKSASEDEEFIDIEKSLEKAMRIPSLIDMYTEHVNETMGTRLPALAEQIKESDPEKAKKIMEVANEYNNSFLYTRLRQMYDTKSSIRKAVRKDYNLDSLKKRCANVNYFNSDTKFKMPDSFKLVSVLSNILRKYDYEIYPSDVQKFLTLLLESASYLNYDDVTDMSYLYYLIKNISMLSYVGDSLSDFSVELINNIMTTIFYIRVKEEESNGRNSSSKHNNKHKSGRKK